MTELSLECATILNSGDLLIWHGGYAVCFDTPEYFQKVCLLVPLDTFEAVLPEAKSYAGAHLRQQHSVSRLLESCLSTLADDVLTNDSESAGAAVELTLGLLSDALTRHRESSNIGPGTNVYQRISLNIPVVTALSTADLGIQLILNRLAPA